LYRPAGRQCQRDLHYTLSVAPILCLGALFAFCLALLQPVVPNPLVLTPITAWTLACYAFAVPVIAIQVYRRQWPHASSFHHRLAAYMVGVGLKLLPGVDRLASAHALLILIGQVAVFFAVRAAAGEWPAAGRFVVAALACGIVLLGWAA